MECLICKKQTRSDKNKTCSSKCAKQNSLTRHGKALFELEIEEIYKKISFLEIKNLIENEHYSFSMIKDMLVRDYGLNPLYNIDIIRDYFKKLTNFSFEKYSKTPLFFRFQFKFKKNTPKEEINNFIIKNCQKGQKLTAALKVGQKNSNFKRENSPLCIEFYTKRGLTEVQAKEKILQIAIIGCSFSQKIQYSGLEKKIQNILNENSIIFETQYSIKLLPEEKIFNKNQYIYDLFIPKYNLLIECNGMYWHASKKIYKTGDLIKLPRMGEIPVDYIWKIDDHKEEIAKKRKFNLITIWEDEYRKTMEIINEFLARNRD